MVLASEAALHASHPGWLKLCTGGWRDCSYGEDQIRGGDFLANTASVFLVGVDPV